MIERKSSLFDDDVTHEADAPRKAPPPKEFPAPRPAIAMQADIAAGREGDGGHTFDLKLSSGKLMALPAKFVNEMLEHSERHYKANPNLAGALRAGVFTASRDWERSGSTLIRKAATPLQDLVNARKARANEDNARTAAPRETSAGSAAFDVEAARHLWDEAKRSGDPDRLTRAANDLLRATERADASGKGDGAFEMGSGAYHPIDERLARQPGLSARSAPRSPSSEPTDGDGAAEPTHEAATYAAAGRSPSIAQKVYRGQENSAASEMPDQLANPTLGRDDAVEVFRNAGQPQDYYSGEPSQDLDRVRRFRHRGFRVAPHEGKRHWVDPNAGWDEETVDETIRESGGRPVTPELCLIFSNEVYPDNREQPPALRAARWRASSRPGIQARGWQFIDEEKGDAYYGMAVYDAETNTLVIANRGSNISSEADRTAAWAIIDGRDTPQIRRAQTLFYRALARATLQARKQGKPPPQVVVTGHSLGGAMAQIQMATVFVDPNLRGRLKITGVTFGALGARAAVGRLLRENPRWRNTSPSDLDAYLRRGMINYYREGDGIVLDRLQNTPMPGRYGTDVVLAGIGMDSLISQEKMQRTLLAPTGSDSAFSSEAGRRGLILLSMYSENHSLLSYYHPDFVRSVGDVLQTRVH